MSKSVIEELMEAIGQVADLGGGLKDVREKMVEEPWFGRTVSPHGIVSNDVVTFANHGPLSMDTMQGDMAKAMGYVNQDQSLERDQGLER